MAAETAEDQSAETKGVAAVDRALTILGAFLTTDEPLRLSQIAAATGLYKSTILRLMASLERFGYLRRLPDGRYQLGATPFALGAAYQNSFKLSDHVVPVLRRLVAEGTESASFHIREGGTRICLYRVQSGHSTVDQVAEGDMLPLDKGAAGKVLLAFDGEKGQKFDEIRKRRAAISRGERDAECGAVAAPVFGPRVSIIGALSVSGPLSRFTPERTEWQLEKVIAAAASLTNALGGDATRFPSS